MATVHVNLKQHSYPIFIEKGMLQKTALVISEFVRSRKAFIVTDDTVAKLYLENLQHGLKTNGFDVTVFVVKSGEDSKTFAQAFLILEAFLQAKCDRGSFLIALGGGVVGDLTGFCASILLRGIDFIQIPTTLLAQVDSSVGGKTGVNSSVGKNLIGTFYQPKAVLIDPNTLQTLDIRQRCAGYAEIVKYGLIQDVDFWEWLQQNGQHVLELEDGACHHALLTSCSLKAQIVAADEHELNDTRALLNFGHTFGHALETLSGMNGSILHGEAIAIGMYCASRLSADLGLCSFDVSEKIKQHFNWVGLPTSYAQFDPKDLVKAMFNDKKTLNARLNLVLLNKIGQASLVKNVEEASIVRAFAYGKED